MIIGLNDPLVKGVEDNYGDSERESDWSHLSKHRSGCQIIGMAIKIEGSAAGIRAPRIRASLLYLQPVTPQTR